MNHVNCNLCGHDDVEVVNRGPDLLLNRHETYQLVRCLKCGLIYQNPQLSLDEALLHYPDTYQRYCQDIESERSSVARLDRRNGLNRLCKPITRRRPNPGTLLDIGCATGVFLDAMRSFGWQVHGVEPNQSAADYAHRVLDLAVHAGTLEEAAYDDDMFDVVRLWDVFEHVIDPKGTLAEIARVLKPDGLLVMSLPNPTCLEARLFGAAWAGWDRPRHLHLFTPAVIDRYLAEAGMTTDSIEGFSARLSLTLLSVEYWCNARQIPERKWRPILRLLYNWPLRILTWPIYKIGDSLRQTSNMVVYATPKGHDVNSKQQHDP